MPWCLWQQIPCPNTLSVTILPHPRISVEKVNNIIQHKRWEVTCVCGGTCGLCLSRASRGGYSMNTVGTSSSFSSWKCHLGKKKVKNEAKGRNWSLEAVDLVLILQRAVLDEDISAPTSAVRKG